MQNITQLKPGRPSTPPPEGNHVAVCMGGQGFSTRELTDREIRFFLQVNFLHRAFIKGGGQ